MAAVMGGIIGQEVLKACTGKFTPAKQHFYFEASHALVNDVDQNNLMQYASKNTRYDDYINIFGSSIQEKMQKLNYFLIICLLWLKQK